MQISKLRFTALALVFALFFAALGAGATLAAQPHMVNARNYLNSALNELKAANANQGRLPRQRDQLSQGKRFNRSTSASSTPNRRPERSRSSYAERSRNCVR